MRRSLLALFVLLGSSACAMPSLDVQPRYSLHDISGSASVSSSGLGGAADLEQAGLDTDESLSGRVDLEFGSPHLILLGQTPEFRGSGTIDVTVSDGTNTIVGGADVDSAVDLQVYDLALVFDLVPGDTLEVAIGLGAAYLDGSVSFREQGTGTTVESSQAVPVPLLVGAASVWMGPLELSLLVGGMQYTFDGDTVRYLDADLFARWKVLGGDERLRASLVAGYRRTEFELDYTDDSADVDSDFTIDGLYFGLEFSL